MITGFNVTELNINDFSVDIFSLDEGFKKDGFKNLHQILSNDMRMMVGDAEANVISKGEIRDAIISAKKGIVDMPLGIYNEASLGGDFDDVINDIVAELKIDSEQLSFDFMESFLVDCGNISRAKLNYCTVINSNIRMSLAKNSEFLADIEKNVNINKSVLVDSTLHENTKSSNSFVINCNGSKASFSNALISGGLFNFSFCENERVHVLGPAENIDSKLFEIKRGWLESVVFDMYNDVANDMFVFSNKTVFKLDSSTLYLPSISPANVECGSSQTGVIPPEHLRGKLNRMLLGENPNARSYVSYMINNVYSYDVTKSSMGLHDHGVNVSRIYMHNNGSFYLSDADIVVAANKQSRQQLGKRRLLESNKELIDIMKGLNSKSKNFISSNEAQISLFNNIDVGNIVQKLEDDFINNQAAFDTEYEKEKSFFLKYKIGINEFKMALEDVFTEVYRTEDMFSSETDLDCLSQKSDMYSLLINMANSDCRSSRPIMYILSNKSLMNLFDNDFDYPDHMTTLIDRDPVVEYSVDLKERISSRSESSSNSIVDKIPKPEDAMIVRHVEMYVSSESDGEFILNENKPEIKHDFVSGLSKNIHSSPDLE